MSEEPKAIDVTAWINEKHYCGDCGWPVVETAVNDEMIAYAKAQDPVNGPYADWWMYCANKGCIHHTGGISNMFECPEWAKKH